MVNPNKKKQCIFFGSRQLVSHIPKNAVVSFDGTSIRLSSHVIRFGLHMDQYLMFDAHSSSGLSSKVIGGLSFISHFSMNFYHLDRVIAVHSLV